MKIEKKGKKRFMDTELKYDRIIPDKRSVNFFVQL